MSVERILDPIMVEKAEFARQGGDVISAAQKAGSALGYPDHPLSSDALEHLSTDPQLLSIIGCLARIQVDSLKSVANQAKLPQQTLSSLETALQTIITIELNTVFNSAIYPVTHDHKGREHRLWPEMKRDMAKVLFAAKDLYQPAVAHQLVRFGEHILQKTYDEIPDDHPTKPLIGIEIQLSRASRR